MTGTDYRPVSLEARLAMHRLMASVRVLLEGSDEEMADDMGCSWCAGDRVIGHSSECPIPAVKSAYEAVVEAGL